jgi:hypothetical protein
MTGSEAHLKSVCDMGFQPMPTKLKPRLSHDFRNPSSKHSAHLLSSSFWKQSNTASGELGFLSWNDVFTFKIACMGWKPMSHTRHRRAPSRSDIDACVQRRESRSSI